MVTGTKSSVVVPSETTDDAPSDEVASSSAQAMATTASTEETTKTTPVPAETAESDTPALEIVPAEALTAPLIDGMDTSESVSSHCLDFEIPTSILGHLNQ